MRSLDILLQFGNLKPAAVILAHTLLSSSFPVQGPQPGLSFEDGEQGLFTFFSSSLIHGPVMGLLCVPTLSLLPWTQVLVTGSAWIQMSGPSTCPSSRDHWRAWDARSMNSDPGEREQMRRERRGWCCREVGTHQPRDQTQWRPPNAASAGRTPKPWEDGESWGGDQRRFPWRGNIGNLEAAKVGPVNLGDEWPP